MWCRSPLKQFSFVEFFVSTINFSVCQCDILSGRPWSIASVLYNIFTDKHNFHSTHRYLMLQITRGHDNEKSIWYFNLVYLFIWFSVFRTTSILVTWHVLLKRSCAPFLLTTIFIYFELSFHLYIHSCNETWV